MGAAKNEKVDSRVLTVRLSHNERSGSFFMDLWEGVQPDAKYIISIHLTEAVAVALSRETGIKILM